MDVRIDAVHDLLRVAEAYGESAVNGSLPSLVAVVAIAGFVLVAAFGGIRWYRQAALFAQPPATLLVLGLGLAAFAALLDVPDEKAFGSLLGFAVRPVEESIELAAAVVLFQAAWRLRQMSCMAA